MSITVTPASLAFTEVGVGTTVLVNQGTFTGTYSVSSSAPAVAFAQGGNSVGTATGSTGTATFTIIPMQVGTCTFTFTDGTLTATLPTTVIVPLITTVNTGYTSAQAMAMVYLRTNENANSLANTSLLTLLNAALSEVSDVIGPQRANVSIPTANGQNVVALPNDVQDVISASFSTTSPAGTGSQVYRLTQMDQGQFMDFSGGLPGTGFGPPIVWFYATDENGILTVQLYPPAFVGQLNLYYRQRPTLWTGAGPDTTNMDPQAQEAAILWTCARVCESREKMNTSDMYMKQYLRKIDEAKDIIQRRTTPKSGQVTDVMTMGRPGFPPWTF